MQGQSWSVTKQKARSLENAVLNKCEEGKIEWKDKKCYKVDQGEMFETCVADEKGEIVFEENAVTCKMLMNGDIKILQKGEGLEPL